MVWEVYIRYERRGFEVGTLKKGGRGRRGSVVQFCTRINSGPTPPSSK